MNEEVLERLVVAKTPDDVRIIVKECDIDLSDEDAERLFAELGEIRASIADGEMDDEELDAVVGGFSFSDLKGKVHSFIKQHADSISSVLAGPISSAFGWKSSKE